MHSEVFMTFPQVEEEPEEPEEAAEEAEQEEEEVDADAEDSETQKVRSQVWLFFILLYLCAALPGASWQQISSLSILWP